MRLSRFLHFAMEHPRLDTAPVLSSREAHAPPLTVQSHKKTKPEKNGDTLVRKWQVFERS